MPLQKPIEFNSPQPKQDPQLLLGYPTRAQFLQRERFECPPSQITIRFLQMLSDIVRNLQRQMHAV